MRIIVTGSREWPGTWEDIAVHMPESGDVTIIHGACSRIMKGVEVSVDTLAAFAARGLGHHVEAYPVVHRLDGPWSGAGPGRNKRMFLASKPDGGIAFGPLWRESGTQGRCADCDNVIESTTEHTWCSGTSYVAKSYRRTGTGGMVEILLEAKLPVRWISAPGADPQDLTKMPAPPVGEKR